MTRETEMLLGLGALLLWWALGSAAAEPRIETIPLDEEPDADLCE